MWVSKSQSKLCRSAVDVKEKKETSITNYLIMYLNHYLIFCDQSGPCATPTFLLEKTGAWASVTDIKVGERITLKTSVCLPTGDTDVRLEVRRAPYGILTRPIRFF